VHVADSVCPLPRPRTHAEFELNYEVHKRRSANFFCGLIAFDQVSRKGGAERRPHSCSQCPLTYHPSTPTPLPAQGHRTTTGFCGAIVRYGVWVVALLLLLVAVVVNAPQMTDPALAMPGYTRFTAYGAACVTNRAPGAGFGWGDAADFIPMLLLVVFSTYTGASLWRYGTTISTDVRATSLNPWASVTLATVGLTLAWALSPLAWPLPYATQAMLLGVTAALVVTQACVESNLRTLEEWAAIVAAANDEVRAVGAVGGGGGAWDWGGVWARVGDVHSRTPVCRQPSPTHFPALPPRRFWRPRRGGRRQRRSWRSTRAWAAVRLLPPPPRARAARPADTAAAPAPAGHATTAAPPAARRGG
jgi:hypothetical protein